MSEKETPKVILDEDDPFESALADLVMTNRSKRRDYAHDGDPFSNFKATAEFAGFEVPWMSALFNCSQKLARISSLRSNGRLEDTSHEGVQDTLLDNAVYAIIAYSMFEWTRVRGA